MMVEFVSTSEMTVDDWDEVVSPITLLLAAADQENCVPGTVALRVKLTDWPLHIFN